MPPTSKKQKRPQCHCGKRAYYAFEGQSAKCCGNCKELNMIIVGQKLCKCKKTIPRYGFPKERAICCSHCKTDEMVNVVTPRCQCGRAVPTFGFKDSKAVCCKK